MTSRHSHRHSHGGRKSRVDEAPQEVGGDSGRPEEPESEATAAPAETEADAPPSAEEQAPDLAAELQLQRDRYLRLAAEYDNYRKRTERERAEAWTRAQAQLVERLLDAFDDLQRVGHFEPENTTVEALLEGVQLVERKLLRALDGAGLEVIDAAGQPFDPEVHEALVSTPSENPEDDDTVAEVFQKGYRFKGHLLRPARVRVSKYEG